MRRYIRETWISDALAITHRSTFCESTGSSPQPDERPVCVDVPFILGMGQADGAMAGYDARGCTRHVPARRPPGARQAPARRPPGARRAEATVASHGPH